MAGHRGPLVALGVALLRQHPWAGVCAAFAQGFQGGGARGGPIFFFIHSRGAWGITTAFLGVWDALEVPVYLLSYAQPPKKVHLIVRSPQASLTKLYQRVTDLRERRAQYNERINLRKGATDADKEFEIGDYCLVHHNPKK